MTHCTARSFECSLHAPGRSRAWLRETLRSWLPASQSADGLLDDAELCVSELVTNSVTAGCGTATLSLELTEHGVRLAVADDAEGEPVQARAELGDLSGRGLSLIAAIADSWGIESASSGKQVWVELVA